MTDPALQAQVHAIDKTVAAHLAECTVQNKQIWIEIRGFKRAMWVCVGGGYSILLTIIGALVKLHYYQP